MSGGLKNADLPAVKNSQMYPIHSNKSRNTYENEIYAQRCIQYGL
jgi:hypothetical protein